MATIIRARQTREEQAGDTVRPVSYTFRDMALQGDAYVTQVRAEAAKIVQQAQSEADAVREKAEQEGRNAAHQAIQQLIAEETNKRMQSLLPALESLVHQLTEARTEWSERWEQNAVKLGLAIAERLVRRELAQTPEVSLDWIREAVELAAGSSEVTIRLSPADHQHLGNEVQMLTETIGRMSDARVVSDPTIDTGGCLLETKYGEIDTRLATQLDRLEEELNGS